MPAGSVDDLDLDDPAHVRDPYPVFRALRAADPVHWSESLGGWMLTRYRDVELALRSDDFSVDTIRPFLRARRDVDPDVARLARLAPLWAVFNDPPDHTRLRAALNRGFTSSQVRRLHDDIVAVTEALVRPLRERDDCGFVRDVAYPLPALVIAKLLGVPDGDVEGLKQWSDDLGEFVTTGTSPQRYQRASAAMEAMAEYFAGLVAERRARPADDLLNGLVAALDAGVFTSQDELLSNCILLLFAGHETTTNLLTSGLYHLVDNPAGLDRVRCDPALFPAAVEELLRYDNPAHGLTRIVARDVSLGGRTLPRGDPVFAFVTAANRDPDVFDDPEVLDVGRAPNRHLSFGKGIHFCLGAPLARLEAVVALPRIVATLGDVQLAEEPTWKPLLVLRSIEELRLRYEAAS